MFAWARFARWHPKRPGVIAKPQVSVWLKHGYIRLNSYTYTISRKSCKYTTLRGRNIHKSRLKFLHEFAGGHHASVHGKWKTTYLKTKEPWRALIWFWSQATLKVPSVFRHLNSWIFKNHLGDDFPLQADGEIPDPHFFFEASTLGAEPQKITEEFLMKCLDAKKAEQLVKAYQELYVAHIYIYMAI